MRQTRPRNNPRQRTRGSPRVTPAGAYVVSITRLSIRTADHNFGSIRCDMLDPWRAYMWLPLIMASPKSLCRAIHPACSNISLMAAKPGAASEYRRPQMRPPSTTRSSPLMNPASSLARKTAELAISSVMPERGITCSLANLSLICAIVFSAVVSSRPAALPKIPVAIPRARSS